MEDIIGKLFTSRCPHSFDFIDLGIDGTEAFIETYGDDRQVFKVLASLTVGDYKDEATSDSSSVTEGVTPIVANQQLSYLKGHNHPVSTSSSSDEGYKVVDNSEEDGESKAKVQFRRSLLIKLKVLLRRRLIRSND